MTDYSHSRHSHPDSVSCADAGDAGHPPWLSEEDWDKMFPDEWDGDPGMGGADGPEPKRG